MCPQGMPLFLVDPCTVGGHLWADAQVAFEVASAASAYVEGKHDCVCDGSAPRCVRCLCS